MRAIEIQTQSEVDAMRIIDDARRSAEINQQLGLPAPTWEEYESYKARLIRLRIEPEQYAICCGILAKVLGL